MEKDIFGKALEAYYNGALDAVLKVESDTVDTEEWPVAIFFHNGDYAMQPKELRALTLASGRTLDVGAGSGCHALWLQDHGVDVEALDFSPAAAKVMRCRGVRRVHEGDFFAFQPAEAFDTVLLLMNGTGIAGTLDRLGRLLAKAKSLLSPGGQILVDSTDLIYLYEEEDGSYSLPIGGRYYGEMSYTYVFRGERSDEFSWLFVDQRTLADAAQAAGLSFEVVFEGDNCDYLARLVAK